MTDKIQSDAPARGSQVTPIYQVIATDDDEGAGKDVWMDVTKEVFDDLKQRHDIRYRILHPDYAAQPPAAPVETERCCKKCGAATKGEEAYVDGQIWCHPCADSVSPCSAATEYENWTLHRQPRDQIVDHEFSIWSGEHPVVLANEMPGEEGALAYIVSVLNIAQPQALSVSEEERHAIEHARYQIGQASILYPDCCFDMDLVKDLVRALDRAYPVTRPQRCDGADDLEHLDGMLDDRERG